VEAETYLRLLAEREIRNRTTLDRLRNAAAVLTEAPSPADLPESWRSVLTQFRRRHPQPARGDAVVTSLAMPLPDLDGLRVLLTGLRGSHLHLIARGMLPPGYSSVRSWSYGPGPVLPAQPTSPLSAWARDDGGNWHLAAADGFRIHQSGIVSTTLTFVPPLGRDVTELTLTVTGPTVTLPVRN
jgi:hypothetical protein